MIDKFKKDFEWARNKNIFLYGIGQKTSILLSDLADFNIVGLIDKNAENIGKVICGITVYDIKEVEKYKDVVIIIVTSSAYHKTITLRIKKYFDMPDISIYYYTGEKASLPLEKNKNPYINIKLEELLKKIESNDIISFDLFDTLIMRKALFPLKNSTINEEIECTLLRNDIKKAYDYAKKIGKKIIITTDMYLSKCEIKKLLEHLKIDSYTELFVSSDINKTKSDGTMYAYIKEKFQGKIGVKIDFGHESLESV